MSISFLEETLTLASQELLNRFNHSLNIDVKSDFSIVTDADLASEKIILERIHKYFPKDKIFSEESGMSAKRQEGDYYWIVDPLDGTTNYSRSYPFFCVSIARAKVVSGIFEPILGGVINPISSKMYIAEKGGGAFCNGKRMDISGPAPEFNKSYLCTGFYYNRGKELEEDITRFSKVAACCQPIRRDGAAALDLALTAEGIFDGFWEKGLKPWDIAAGCLLITESGGVVRSYESGNYHVEQQGIISGKDSTVRRIAELIL